MKNKLVYLDKKEGIGTIYFNRSEKRNAMNMEMWKNLAELVHQCENDRDIKVVIFRGTDDIAFSAGADISEFKSMRYNAEGAEKYNSETFKTQSSITHLSKPTIAMIQGVCVGGGCEIAISCDFRFAAPHSKFGITPAKLGIVYNLPGMKHLVELVGPSKTKDILYTGRLLEAEESRQIGLIDRIYNSDELVSATYQYAKAICQNAQFSVRGSKFVIKKILEGEINDTEEITKLVLDSFETDDYKEGVKAFLEKRKANFEYS